MVNIRPEELVNGNPKLTLGLIWRIILHFQVSLSIDVRVKHSICRDFANLITKEKLESLLYMYSRKAHDVPMWIQSIRSASMMRD